MCIEKWKYQFGARLKGNHWTCKISDSLGFVLSLLSLWHSFGFLHSLLKEDLSFVHHQRKSVFLEIDVLRNSQPRGATQALQGIVVHCCLRVLANHALAFAFCDFLSEERWWEELKVVPPANSDSSNKWNPFTDFSCFLSCLQLTSNFLKIDFCAVVIPNMCPCLLNTLPFFLSEMLNAFKEEWCWPRRSTVWMTLLAKGG